MSKRDDRRDSAHKSQGPDAGASFESEAVKAFVEAVGAREGEDDFSGPDLIEFLMPQLEELDREVSVSIEKRDGLISDLASQVNQKKVELSQLMGRLRRDRERLPGEAKERFALAMLEVVDGFDAAAKMLVDVDESVLVGFRMISRSMDDALKTQGFIKIDASEGQNVSEFHHVIEERETADHDSGIVIEVDRSGYLNETTGNVLRPARVIVAKNPPTDAENRETCAESDGDSDQ